MVEPRRVLRYVFLGRLSLAAAIFLAAVFSWHGPDAGDTLLATLALLSAIAFTSFSAWFGLAYRTLVGRAFYYTQSVFDVALITTIVHITGGSLSPFAALYILATACASLLLPVGGGLLIAALGNVLYFADVIVLQGTALGTPVILQLGVFAVTALGVAYLGARLQEAGVNREALAAQLVVVKLQAEDVLKNIRSGIVTIDVEGRILFANSTAGKLIGFDAESVRGHNIRPVIAAGAPALSAALERAVHGVERVTRGEAAITVHGRTFPIGFTTTTMSADGSPDNMSATVIFQDISDNKRLEELRLRAERLEAVAELSASLAHEIKNPLASIRSAVEQLGAAPRATEDERILAHLIVRESDRLARLLSEFLDFARVRVTRGERVNMGEVAQAAVRLADTHPDRKLGVTVTCVIPTEALLVEGDEDLLHRAIFNITLNAVQAAPVNTGRVTVEVSKLTLEQIPTGVPFEVSAVALRVSDNGPGIPIELRERVFDPFFTTKSGGTGLGLPIVHRAIEAHRGFVFMDSSPKGTRFTVLLPQYQRRAAMEGVT
ncbi:MAG: nitrogen regulation protein NR(II) [Gemmatimonadales bacterium]|jgi:two-component system sensor histidine kinase PilS (NtrC family)